MSTDEISIRRCTWLLKQRGFKFWAELEKAPALASYASVINAADKRLRAM